MNGLQRSSVSFRRQGSSGLVWEDRLPSASSLRERQGEEKAQFKDGGAPPRINTIGRSRSAGGALAFGTGRVSPSMEPPSPKFTVCGFCSGFGKSSKSGTTKPSKRRRG